MSSMILDLMLPLQKNATLVHLQNLLLIFCFSFGKLTFKIFSNVSSMGVKSDILMTQLAGTWPCSDQDCLKSSYN